MSKPLFLLYDKYEKKLPQALTYKKTTKQLELYFKNNNKYSIYTLATHFKMSKFRFVTQYIKHKDENMRELIASAMDVIVGHCFESEDQYARVMKYILAQAELGQPFIERDEQVQSSVAKVMILPSKEK